MKYLKFLVLAGFLTGFAFLIGCKPDEPPQPTDEELRLEDLAGTWALSTVTLDLNDRASDWTGFTLTLTTSKSFQTSNGSDETVWPATGTFSFAGTEGAGLDTIIRSDQVQVNVDAISVGPPGALTLSFNISLAQANKDARLKGIEGAWVFSFTK